MKKRKYYIYSLISMILGISMLALTASNKIGVSADSAEALDHGILVMKFAMIIGIFLVAIAAGCFLVAVTSNK